MAVFSLGDRFVRFASNEWFIAHNAAVIGSVVVGHQASVWYNVTVRGDNDVITLGDRVNVQDGSVLHADPSIPLTLEEDVSIGHQVMLHGCTIGAGSLVGIGAIVLNHAKIGRRSIVGAGALVPEGKSYPDNVLLLGTPAKVVRELKPEDHAMLARITEVYVNRAQRFRAELKPQAT